MNHWEEREKEIEETCGRIQLYRRKSRQGWRHSGRASSLLVMKTIIPQVDDRCVARARACVKAPICLDSVIYRPMGNVFEGKGGLDELQIGQTPWPHD